MQGRLTVLIVGVLVAAGCGQAPTTVNPQPTGDFEAMAARSGRFSGPGRHGVGNLRFDRFRHGRFGHHRFDRFGRFGHHRFDRFDRFGRFGRFGFGFPNVFAGYPELLGFNYAYPVTVGYTLPTVLYNPYNLLFSNFTPWIP